MQWPFSRAGRRRSSRSLSKTRRSLHHRCSPRRQNFLPQVLPLLLEPLEDRLTLAANFDFAVSFGAPGIDLGKDIAVDAAGNAYVVGSFNGTVDFDPGAGVTELTSIGADYDIFIVKFSPAGVLVWAKQIDAMSEEVDVGGSISNFGPSVTADTSGFVYIASGFQGAVDFNPGTGEHFLVTTANQSGYILKLTGAGAFVWVKTISGTGGTGSFVRDLAVDGSGNVLAVGDFFGLNDFDPSNTANNFLSGIGDSDAFVWKLSSAGSFVWAQSLVGVNSDRAHQISLDSVGNAYVTGFHGGFMDLNPGSGSFVLTDPSSFAVKLSGGTGAFMWGRTLNLGALDLDPRATATDDQNNLLVAGSDGGDLAILKISPAGSTIWSRSFVTAIVIDGVVNDQATIEGLDVDSLGNVYLTGFFHGTVDFDLGAGVFNLSETATHGQADIFVSALDTNGDFRWARSLPAEYSQLAVAIAVDLQRNIYVTGYFDFPSYPVDFDPGQGTFELFSILAPPGFILAPADAFLLKLNAVGPLVYQARSGNGADQFVLRRNGAYLELLENDILISHDALDDVTGVVLIGTNGEADNLTIDFGNGLFVLPNGIQFNGNGGSNGLTVLSGSLTNVTYDLNGAGAGVLRLDTLNVTFSNLQTLNDHSIGVNRVFNAKAAGAQDFSLVSANSTENLLSGSLIELVFRSPSTSFTLNTGDGNDTIALHGTAPNFTGSLTVNSGADNDTILVQSGTAFAGAVTLNGGANDDIYQLDADGITTVGPRSLAIIETTGGGIDSLDFSLTTALGVSANLSLTSTQVVNARLSITLTSGTTFENLIGGSLNDILTGNSLNNRLTGGPGNDTYVFDTDAHLGNDTLVEATGVGTDLLNFSPTTTQVVTVDLGNRALQAINGNLSLVLSETATFENVTGGSLGDRLTGNSLANLLTGGPGNDTYLFNTDSPLGTDTLNESGGGVDTLDFSATTLDGVAVNLATAANQLINKNLSLILSAGNTFENIVGGSLNDTLAGNVLANNLAGGPGDDRYVFDADLALSSDTLTDTGGTDTLDFSSTTTQAITLDLSSAVAQQVGVVNINLTLTLVKAPGLFGNPVFENIIATPLNDRLTGNLLNNRLVGGAGNDTYVFSPETAFGLGTDTLDESGGGIDTLDFSATLGQNISIDLSKAVSQIVVTSKLTLILGAGNTFENVIGGSLNDSFTGNALSNRLTGGPGNDTYVFDTDNQLGSDTIDESGGGNDSLDFSFTSTKAINVNLALVSQAVNTNLTNLTLALSPVNSVENIIGGALADTLAGNTLANRFTGNGGNDTMTGGGGNDTYIFDADTPLGTDTVDESAGGIDTLDFSPTTTQNVAIDLFNPALQVVNAANLSLILRSGNTIDNVIGGSLNDTITGNALNNILTGGPGSDTYFFDLDFSLAQDLIVENLVAGSDTLDFSPSTTNAVTVDLSVGSAQPVCTNLTLSLSSGLVIENVIGTSQNDVLTGNLFGNRLTGGPGNDALNGAGGIDTYVFDTDAALGIDTLTESGTDIDTLDFAQTTLLAVSVNLSAASQTVNNNLALVLNSSTLFENVIGGTLGDSMTGNSINNRLAGGPGNDTYFFDTDLPLGADTLDEPVVGGIDTLDFSLTTTKVIAINLSLDTVQTISSSNLTLILLPGGTFENVIGGSQNDTLTGNTFANSLSGNGGADTLTGGGGNDSLVGGPGDDTYFFDTDLFLGTDTLDESVVGGFDTLDFSATIAVGVNIDLSLATPQLVNGNLTLLLRFPISFENITGSAQADRLTGNSLDNLLAGRGGNDTVTGGGGTDMLTGGGGNDTYVFDTDTQLGTDTIDESAGGVDTLDFSGTATQKLGVDISNPDLVRVNANLSLVLLAGNTIENVIGGAFDDLINGNALNNNLRGGPGNDTLIGNDLDDTLAGEEGNDTLLGGNGNDILVPSSGTDSMDGGPGQDGVAIYGTAGNDHISVSWQAGPHLVVEINGQTSVYGYANGETIFAFAGAGNDQVVMEESAGLRWRAEFHGEGGNDHLVGSLQNDKLDGGAGNDRLEGGAGNDILIGGAGNDHLDGAAGNDLLIGGAGNDYLQGGAGDDELVGNAEQDRLEGGPGTNRQLRSVIESRLIRLL